MDNKEEALERAKRREANARKLKQRHQEVRRVACECFATDSGKEFLRWLAKECGFHSPSSVVNAETGEISFNATIHNEARRGIYLRVRALLESRPDILAEVENNIKGENNG